MSDDKFILMGIDDDNSKEIAEILKSKTAKKILDFLSEVKEASEKDIADYLEIPLNTAEYNLKKLVKSGLVEKSSNFFWSVKGKKIPMYKLAKKHIIIGTKKPSLSILKNILPVILIAIVLIAIILLMYPIDRDKREINELKKFNSLDDLKIFLEENSRVYKSGGVLRASSGIAESASSKANADTGLGYSTTNIQVEGIDEADIIKNDGKYIYVVSNNKVFIINAFPAEKMVVLSEINFTDDYVSELYVNDDKLILFSNRYFGGCRGDVCILKAGETAVSVATIDFAIDSESKLIAPDYYSEPESKVYVYDISDRENPKLEDEIKIQGSYLNSRMIDDYVYLISNKYININNPEPPIYYINEKKIETSASDIYYFDYADNNYIFTTIYSINLNNGEINYKTYLIGVSGNIYVSKDNIYLSYQKSRNIKDYVNRFANEIALPLLPDEKDNEVKSLLDKLDDYQKLYKINQIIYDYSNSLRGNEKDFFDNELMKLSENFEIQISKEYDKSIIHKINVDKGNINYGNVGEVPGRILNQFSMDEYNGYFRVATTTGETWRETSLNHLYILDENLKIVGSIEDLAKGEQIYSTRFLRDKVYIVTFRQVDPLYVIDTGNPRNPVVLGYLKVTGYSSYLHPYDENNIIGIGMEASEEGRVQGLKIALFDVSDFENPKEKAKFEINSEIGKKNVWSSSEVLYDHKAFLFDKEKGILVIPVSYNIYDDSNEYWQGAYIFSINEDNLELRGKISHSVKDEYSDIRRSLYIDDTLYTASMIKIKANNINDLKDINEIILK